MHRTSMQVFVRMMAAVVARDDVMHLVCTALVEALPRLACLQMQACSVPDAVMRRESLLLDRGCLLWHGSFVVFVVPPTRY